MVDLGYTAKFPVSLPFLKPGVFHLQQIQPVSLVRLDRKLGVVPPMQLTELRQAIVRLLAWRGKPDPHPRLSA